MYCEKYRPGHYPIPSSAISVEYDYVCTAKRYICHDCSKINLVYEPKPDTAHLIVPEAVLKEFFRPDNLDLNFQIWKQKGDDEDFLVLRWRGGVNEIPCIAAQWGSGSDPEPIERIVRRCRLKNQKTPPPQATLSKIFMIISPFVITLMAAFLFALSAYPDWFKGQGSQNGSTVMGIVIIVSFAYFELKGLCWWLNDHRINRQLKSLA